MVKNSPAMLETWVRSLGWENPLEKGMATHSSILTWRILWTEEPGGLQSMGLKRVGHDWVTNTNLPFDFYCSLSHVQLFATQWTVARQASLFITNSQSLLKFMSIELVMPSNHLILCHSLLLLPSISQHQGLFPWGSSLHQMAKVLELQLQHQPFQWMLRVDFL